MTPELLSALESWTRAGRRTAKIEIDNYQENTMKIWVYDYDLQQGVFISNISDIPTRQQLEEKRVATLKNELSCLTNGYEFNRIKEIKKVLEGQK